MAEILNITGEVGDESEFSAVVEEGSALFDNSATAALNGTTRGFLVTPDGSNRGYGRNDFTEFASTGHGMRGYFHFPLIDLDDGTFLWIMQLVDSVGTSVTSVRITVDSGVYKADARTANNAAGTETTTAIAFDETVPHWFEVQVFRHATTGYIRLFIDGLQAAQVEGIANSTAIQPDETRFGHTFTDDGTFASVFYCDEFIVRDDNTFIGPVGVEVVQPSVSPVSSTDLQAAAATMIVPSGLNAQLATSVRILGYSLGAGIDAATLSLYNSRTPSGTALITAKAAIGESETVFFKGGGVRFANGLTASTTGTSPNAQVFYIAE